MKSSDGYKVGIHPTVLSVRFEVGVSFLLAPAGADKRRPKAPFPVTSGIMQEYSRRFAREYLPDLRRELGLTESTALKRERSGFINVLKYSILNTFIHFFPFPQL